MKKRLDARMQERHYVRPLLLAGRKHTPESLQPTIAPVAPSPLRHLPVDHDLADRLFAEVVRCRNIRFDKAKIFVPPIPQPLRDVDRVLAPRTALRNRPPSRLQDRFPMSLHFPQPNAIRKIVVRMNRREHFANLFQQSFSVTGDRLVLALGEKFHFADQMSPAELQGNRCQAVELPVRTPKIARNRSGIVQAQNVFQHDASTRRVDVEQRHIFRSKTPDPTPLAVLLRAGFVDVKMFFVRQKIEQSFVGGAKASVTFRTCFARKPFEIFNDTASLKKSCKVLYDMCPRPLRYAVNAMSFGPKRPDLLTSGGNAAAWKH